MERLRRGFLLRSGRWNDHLICDGDVVWTGIGSVGTVMLGVIRFGESMDATRLVCVGLIVVSSLGLKLISAE